jgi:PPP family 3-phenylpropionic acid transporter
LPKTHRMTDRPTAELESSSLLETPTLTKSAAKGRRKDERRRSTTGLRGLFILLGVAESAVLPFIPLFLRDRGFNAAQIGLLLSCMAVVVLAVSPMWGYLADRRLGVGRCLVVSSVAAALLALCGGLPLPATALIALLMGVWGSRAPLPSLCDALALQRLSAFDRSAYGSVRLWTSAGFAIAAVLWGGALVLLPLTGMLFFYAAGLIGLATWTWLVVPRIEGGAVDVQTPKVRLLSGSSKAILRLLPFLTALLFVSTAFVATWNFVVLRITGLGGSALLVGAAASLQALAEIPAMHWCRGVIARIGERGLFSAGCALYAASFFSWSLLSNPVAIALVRVAVGIGFAFVYVGSVIIVDDLVPSGLRATGQGLAKAVSYGLAPVLGALGGGVMYQTLGPRALFETSAALAVSAAVIVPLLSMST